MRTISKTIILLFVVLVSFTAQAQRVTKIGFTGGAARFYPEAQHLGADLNNSMKNDWGWSAGLFVVDHWKPKIHQIVEINYYSFSSDVYLQKVIGNPYVENSNYQIIKGDYKNTPFNLLAISGGIRYFLNKKLYAYPGFEIARSLNSDIDINKTTYNIKLGAGIDLRGFDVVLEYAYGLKYQRMIYDFTVPFASTHRNTYLLLKVQVPLYRLR